MRFLAAAANGLIGPNGLPTPNGLPSPNGLPTPNGLQGPNGLPAPNGLSGPNGLPAPNGLSGPNGLNAPNGVIGADGAFQKGWNSYFLPGQFSWSVLEGNTIDSSLLGPAGVGDLSAVPGIENNVLDNRFITEELKTMLCREEDTGTDGEVTFRDYFSVLIDLAWPLNAEFWLCCSEPAAVEGLEPLVFAPHFLTEKFEAGQQEALTAALIAKFNVHGKTLLMDLTGRFDLGLAGKRFIAGKEPGFDHYLGNA